MALENRMVRHDRATHPGKVIDQDFLPEYGISVTSLTEKTDVLRHAWQFTSGKHLIRERRPWNTLSLEPFMTTAVVMACNRNIRRKY